MMYTFPFERETDEIEGVRSQQYCPDMCAT